jgi:Zn-dependent protease with chaperone function
LALAPAVVAWWTGRTLLARADDPVLPELLFDRRRKLAGLTLGGALALAILFADDALWAIPLLWITLLLTSYPIRRRLFGERWSALAYLRYAIFSSVGHFGLWLLAGFAPALVTSLALGLEPNNTDAAMRLALWTGGAFGLVIALWQHHYARVFLALHRAVPLRVTARPELMAKLDAIVERAGTALPRRPEVYRYGAPGGYVMNALAIPSLTHPAVALGDTIVATMDDDEIAAIFAHEIAHHEQFTRGRLRRSWLAGLALAALAAGLPALLLRGVPDAALLTSWLVPVVVIMTLGKRVAKRRDAETASDLRATVLTGDPNALARALTKLHVYSRVPRRWPHAIERAATHPSLARRIQALRERGGTLEPHMPEVSAIVRSPSGTVIALDNERVYWFEGVPEQAPLALDVLRAAASSYRAMSYRDLAELRVAADGGARRLVATDPVGHSWSAPIALNDVAALQGALDRVDVKLGQRRPTAAPARAPAVRWLALALLVMLTMTGELGLTVIPLIVVLVRPTLTAAVAATASIALARVVVAARAIAWADPVRQLAALGAVSVAITLIVLAAQRARVDASRGAAGRITREAWILIGILAGVVVVVALGMAPLASERPASLIGNSLAISAVTVLLGLGGALLTLPQRWWRAGGVLTCGASLGFGAVLTRDAWPLGRTRSLTWTTASLRPAGSVTIPGGGLGLAASPNGSAFAITQYHPQRARAFDAARYVIGRFGDPSHALRTSDALKIVFADSETVLALDTAGTDSLELRAEHVAANRAGNVPVAWRERLPTLESPQLIVDRTRQWWLVVGRAEDDASFVVVADTFGGGRPRTYRLATRGAEYEPGEMLTQPIAAFANGNAIWTTLGRFHTGRDAITPLLLAMTGSIRWELHSSSAAGERFLADLDGMPTCGNEIEREAALCYDRSTGATRVWWATAASKVQQIAELPPSLDLVHIESSETLSAAERFGARLLLVDATTRRGARLTLPGANVRGSGRWTADVVARGGYVMVLSAGRDGAVLSRFEVRTR